MKSNFYILVGLLLGISSCNKQELIDPKYLENNGNATLMYDAEIFKESDSTFIIHSSFLDINGKQLGTKEKQTKFGFDLAINETDPYLRNCTSLNHSTSISSPSNNYINLMLINPSNSKIRLYHEATGFFIEKYRKEAVSNNNEFYIGYWSNNNLSVNYQNKADDTSLMRLFYSETHIQNPPKIKGPNDIPFENILISEVFNLLNKAADEIILKAPPGNNKYVTFINYSKINEDNINQTDYAALISKFQSNNIHLNIINYQSAPILNEITFKSGGFVVNSYAAKVIKNDTQDAADYFEKKIKPSNVVIQNLEQLLRKGNLQIENYQHRVCREPINSVNYYNDNALASLNLFIHYGKFRFLIHPIYN